MTHRYGDFPELFWDAQPDAPLDAEHPVVLARILTRGSLEVLTRLVSPRALARHLPSLPLDDHARAFWTRVLGGFDEGISRPPRTSSGGTSAA